MALHEPLDFPVYAMGLIIIPTSWSFCEKETRMFLEQYIKPASTVTCYLRVLFKGGYLRVLPVI